MPSRKGASPVVAATILIAIAVVLAAAILGWQSSSLGSFSRSLEEGTREKLQCERGSLAVLSAAYDCNNNCAEGTLHTASLTLQNPGDVTLNPRFIYIKSAAGRLFELATSGELPIGQTLVFRNATAASCSDFSRAADEIVVTTDCPEVVGIFPGSSISWQNCP